MKYYHLTFLIIIILFSSCSKDENTSSNNTVEQEEISLFYDCGDIEALEPYKFDFYVNGEPLTFMPTSILFDTLKNRLLVLDTKKYQILSISPEGELLQEIGRMGEAVSEIMFPSDIDIDKFGNIYVIDNKKVKIFDSLGVEWKSFISSGQPDRILVVDTNSIYILTVLPIERKILLKYDWNGNLLGEYIDKVEIEHHHPNEKIMLEMLANQAYFAQDSKKNIFVAFANEYRIVKMDYEGNIFDNYITGEVPYEIIKIHKPKDSLDKAMSVVIRDIAIDENDNLYVLWGENLGEPYCRVDVYNSEGEFVDVLKLEIPYTGESYRGVWYISPISYITVYSGYLYACEVFAEGLIYRYDIRM